MALTVNEMISFEEQSLLLSFQSSSSVAITTTAGQFLHGSAALAFASGSDRSATINPFAKVNRVGDRTLFGFWIKLDDVSPSAEILLFQSERSGDEDILMKIATNGDLLVRGANDGATRITVTTPFVINTWHSVVLWWQDLGSGNAEIFIDDLSRGSVSGVNFDGGRGDDEFTLATVSGSGINFWIDSIWIMTDGAVIDRLVNAEVFCFQGGDAQGASPDFTDAGVAGGDALTDGTWQLLAEAPLNEGVANDAEYDGGQLDGCVAYNATNANGSGPGPKDSGDIDGDTNIKAVYYTWRLKRGAGGGTTHFGLWGRWSGTGNADVTQTGDLGLTTAYITYYTFAVSGNIPTANDFFVQGIAKSTGGREIICSDMYATLLHEPAVQAGAGFPPSLYKRNLTRTQLRM